MKLDVLASALPDYILLASVSLLAIQLLILALGTTIRYNKYKSIGLYARKVKWPTTYKVKIWL